MTDDPLGDDPNETLRELHERVVTDPEEVYQIVSSVDSISSFDDEPALNIIGLFVDTAGDTGNEDGLDHAMELADELMGRDLRQGYQSRIQYYLAIR